MSDVDPKLTRDGLRINLEALRPHTLDASAYGRCLGASLFAVPGLRDGGRVFVARIGRTIGQNLPICQRIFTTMPPPG